MAIRRLPLIFSPAWGCGDAGFTSESAAYTTWPELDGLWAPSTMTGRPNVVLWTPAADSFPLRPAFSAALTRTFLYTFVEQAAAALGYEIRTDS